MRDDRLAAGIPCAARPEEERHLDVVLPTELGHLVKIVVGEEHHPGPLRDTVDAEADGGCLLEHGPEDDWPFDARDLDVVRRAVREAERGRRPGPERRLQADLLEERVDLDEGHVAPPFVAVGPLSRRSERPGRHPGS